MNRERLAAALEFDRKRRAQDYLMSEPGTQPLTQGEDVLGFLRGVGGNLAGRAQSAYDLATTPSRWIPEAQNVVTGLVELGKAAISDPAGTGRAIAQGEVQRASQAAGSPEAMGNYAANFIDPLRLAQALRYRGPIAELDVQEPELTRRAKQFQEIKDAAIGKLYNKVDEETGDYIYPQNRSLVEAQPNTFGNYTGEATLKRKIGNGEIHLAIKPDFNNVVGDEDGFGRMHVYLSAEGDVPKGTGAATEMYLEALAIAQQKGLGFVSDSIRSENAENIYRRLIKKGVPFKKGFLYEDKSWVLTSDEVAKLDLSAIAAKPYK